MVEHCATADIVMVADVMTTALATELLHEKHAVNITGFNDVYVI
jgi:hypothetical protein